VRARHTRGLRGGDQGDQWDERSFPAFFSNTAHTLTTEVDPGLLGQHRGAGAAPPWRVEGALLAGVLLTEAIAVLRSCARDFGGATGARAIHEALRALVGKAIDPRAQRGRGQLEGVGDRVEALPFDDSAHGWGTTEDTGRLGLLEEGVSSRKSVLGKVEFEGPHRGRLQNKILQKYYQNISTPRHPTWLPYYRSTAFPTQIFRGSAVNRCDRSCAHGKPRA